jgi:hypothetical protein
MASFRTQILIQFLFPCVALALLPWVVTDVSTHWPSAIQGNAPFCTFKASIQDPNTIEAGPAASNLSAPLVFAPSNVTCQVEWYCMGGDPYDIIRPCGSDDNGYWTFKMVKAANTTADSRPSPFNNFDLVLTRVAKVGWSPMYIKQFEGRGHFEAGKNMRGVCGGRGQCSWWLKEDSTETIEQKEVECSDWCD